LLISPMKTLPVSLGIVYDVSGSMKERVGPVYFARWRRFIETSHSDDDFFLIGFNDRAKAGPGLHPRRETAYSAN